MRVLNDFVLLRPIGETEEKHGDLYIPEAAQVKSTRGVVVLVGRGEILGGKLHSIDLTPGETVLYSKYADAATLDYQGASHILVRASEIRLVE